MKNALLSLTAAVSLVALTSAAQARSAYDVPGTFSFVTQRGACDPTYNSLSTSPMEWLPIQIW